MAYLNDIINIYAPADLSLHEEDLKLLLVRIQKWAGMCFIEITLSGSRAKGTAISLSSDIDLLVSLKGTCHGSLEELYERLYSRLTSHYYSVRKQNVSIRVSLSGLQVDVTPARKQLGNNHHLFVSKDKSWRKTNIQKHITDISQSRRLEEIKLLKIWRELHKLEFPSIYLEYLVVDKILLNKSTDSSKLADNFWHILKELAKKRMDGNYLFDRLPDPANSSSDKRLSLLLSSKEKQVIIDRAKKSITPRQGERQCRWEDIIW